MMMETQFCPDCSSPLMEICLWFENGVEIYFVCGRCGFEKNQESYHEMVPQRMKAIVGGYG